ncbi:MFS transporter [Pseudonocardia sp. DSM 110487]|uniref:MFS transporter n=1 Tax=Pseudonocardia sp. DSM 110487 TaxID=2865833 RepID=UPI001C6A6F8A|nr:MFS transporter [Pseudonocardia sp. DSM 110487]QYN33682.1 MFS transporter [Pseudonocardia sp. DSM 110487]
MTTTVERAGPREWTGLAVLALPCLLVSMDTHVLNLAVPQLTADLRPTGVQLLWVVDAYGFLVAGSLIAAGALGDRVGRRRMMLCGGAGFGVASVLAAWATTPGQLIAARALQGLCGAAILPSTLSLIRTLFLDRRQRTVAIGIWTASFSLGGVAGPLLAGLLLDRFWWGSVFLVAVPVMALLLVVGPVLIPESGDTGTSGLDVPAALLSLAAVLAVVHGIKGLAQDGPQTGPALSILAGCGLAVAFVHHERGRRHPALAPAVFRNVAFTAPLLTNACAFFVLFGTTFLVAQHLQLVLGLSALEAGAWTIPSSLGYLTGSVLGLTAARRVRPAFVVGAGLVLAAAGFGMLSQVDDGLGLLVAGTVVFSVGLAPVYLVTTEMIVSAAPSHQAGSASAVSETGAELGGALGVAVLGSIGAATYRQAMDAAASHSLPPNVQEGARGTLGGALAAAERLPDGPGAELVRDAREAFEAAFRTVEAVGAGLLAVVAVGAVLVLRRVSS